MIKGFTSLDAKMSSDGGDGTGSTALAVFVTAKHIVVANLGDTRHVREEKETSL